MFLRGKGPQNRIYGNVDLYVCIWDKLLINNNLKVRIMNTNEMFFITQKIIKNFVSIHDPEYFEEILSDDAEIILTVNGQEFRRNKEQYVKNLKQAFSENIGNMHILNLSFEINSPSTIKVMDKSIQVRKGHGLNESGEGAYFVDDVGLYSFIEEGENLKISKIEHTYTKIKTNGE